MRVIAGEHRGRRLKTVPHEATRETSDKVKEAFFHKIGPFFSGGTCLDLFAGSGSLGIEALSRGFERAIFVDKSSLAVRTIRENVQMLQVEERCEIYQNDARRALEKLSQRKMKFALIFIDPPYKSKIYNELVEQIIQQDLLETDGLIYIEHPTKSSSLSLSSDVRIIDEKSYGSTTSITILTKATDATC